MADAIRPYLVIQSISALAAWEWAWQGGDAEPSYTGCIFLPPLLADPAVAILAAYQAERIIAGVIANRTGDVVGLSNLFAPVGQVEHFWSACVAGVMDAFPGLAVVGYEVEEALDHAEAAGFARIGPLRIWVKENSSE